MAAILAQLLRANRARIANRRNWIREDKSVYSLPEFDRSSGGFSARRHNPYLRRREAFLQKERAEALEEHSKVFRRAVIKHRLVRLETCGGRSVLAVLAAAALLSLAAAGAAILWTFWSL